MDPRNGSPADPKTEAPEAVLDLARACVQFVERSLKGTLDFEPETLSFLDHYVGEARAAAKARPETAPVLAHSIGAYFGEVVRRRYPSWWRIESEDPAEWRLELEPVYLSFSPVQLIADALYLPGERPGALPDPSGMVPTLWHPSGGLEPDRGAEAAEAGLELTPEDREAVTERLAALPPVSVEEFYAPSTRLEVIDIAVEAIRARRMGAGEGADSLLVPEDYED
jgi:hypothetical protein